MYYINNFYFWVFLLLLFSPFIRIKGWQRGGTGPKDGVFVPVSPRMTGKIFLPNLRLLGLRETIPHLVKLYFLLICSQLLQLFLIKLVSLIKIYLKLQINLSYQIKLIFSKKKLNNIIKVFNNTILQQIQKSHNTKSMIQ